MTVVPILAHGADLLVLPVVIAAVVTIMIVLKDGRKNRPSMPALPTHPFGRQVWAAMRVPAKAAKPATAPAAGRPQPRRCPPPPLHVIEGGTREPRIPSRSA